MRCSLRSCSRPVARSTNCVSRWWPGPSPTVTRLGAKRVTVGEGPGHQRDTQLVLRATGLEQLLKEQRIPFVDLNRDEVVKVRLRAGYSRLKHLWLPRTALGADVI